MNTRNRTTVSIELVDAEKERAEAIKQQLGLSYPAVFKQFFFAYADIQERALQGLADGSSATLAEALPHVEQRLLMELRQATRERTELQHDMQEVRTLVLALTALFEAQMKNYLVFSPKSTPEQVAAQGPEAKARLASIVQSAAKSLEGGTPQVIAELREQLSQVGSRGDDQ